MHCLNSPTPVPPTNSSRNQQALNAFLVAADGLTQKGKLAEAELRLTEALALAKREFGEHSDQLVLVMSIMAAFYRTYGKQEHAADMERRIQEWTPEEPPVHEPKHEPKLEKPSGLSAKLGAAKPAKEAKDEPAAPAAKMVPHKLRKPCQILGLSTDTPISANDVHRAWKKQMLQQAAHPDLGGNTDEAILLNQAKTELLEYLEFVKPRARSSWKTNAS